MPTPGQYNHTRRTTSDAFTYGYDPSYVPTPEFDYDDTADLARDLMFVTDHPSIYGGYEARAAQLRLDATRSIY